MALITCGVHRRASHSTTPLPNNDGPLRHRHEISFNLVEQATPLPNNDGPLPAASTESFARLHHRTPNNDGPSHRPAGKFRAATTSLAPGYNEPQSPSLTTGAVACELSLLGSF
jgi:hypothetical protein